ncbi:hypothetical protein JMJ77_0012824 [Colletotrichum scovillei]|uniref:Uncharacterized protein n=1 Tax=Colletotrichum scovillei TaxID=1209932 RepID=A0A9P7R7S7_9PEZI|nr:hypothetical protein JMJ77_0012824 [Colletotrichum scovillei]KAG7069106.1 hypothetical protein JMJ76_0002783 [Colletotrichum scovillei]KAG7073059.1 hypothetical protein JMJ78_0014041 [Colletotrichum scovillei]
MSTSYHIRQSDQSQKSSLAICVISLNPGTAG